MPYRRVHRGPGRGRCERAWLATRLRRRSQPHSPCDAVLMERPKCPRSGRPIERWRVMQRRHPKGRPRMATTESNELKNAEALTEGRAPTTPAKAELNEREKGKGGPRTAAGKMKASRNATKHG